MLGEGPLAVSLPPTELGGAKLTGSVFASAELENIPLSPPLAAALDSLTAAAALTDTPLIFVARPEIYTEGVGLAWLRSRLGAARNHLALSDGATIRPIPGLETYVFFYGRSRKADHDALARLSRRAPGLFASLAGQVNSALKFGEYEPSAVVLEGVSRPAPPALLAPILYDPDSRESATARMLSGLAAAADLRAGEWLYALLTESSLDDRRYLDHLAKAMNARLFDRQRGVVLRLPENVGPSMRLDDRIDAAIDALLRAGAKLPFAPTGTQWFSCGEADLSAPWSAAAIDLLAPADCEFWRGTLANHPQVRSLTVHIPPGLELTESFADVIFALTNLAPNFAD